MIKYIQRISNFGVTCVYCGSLIFSKYFQSFVNKEIKKDSYSPILKKWGNDSLKYIDIDVVLECEEIKNKDFGNVLFLSNHQSNLDVLIIYATAPKSVSFVAKKSLFKIPFFGKLMNIVGTFGIDRKNRENAIKTLKIASEKLQKECLSVVMFPEGTRTKDGKLLPFKKGAFHLAIESQIPIIPVTIDGSMKLMKRNDWKLEDGLVKITYGKPIFTKGLTEKDTDYLIEQVKKSIESKL